MNEEYLWDRSGHPDQEIIRLEAVLGQLRRQPPKTSRTPLWMAAAAAVLLLGMGIYRTRETGPISLWQYSAANGKSTSVRTGQVIETPNTTGGTMESSTVGEIQIEPDSRLSLLPTARPQEQRLALDHGTIHAFIWAPPTNFIVDTPSAHAVDLGCQYTLRVSKDGTGFLTVETGWVAFESHNIESFIPAGAACTTRTVRGPGTPHFLDAPGILTAALDTFDSTGNSEALQTVLSASRPRDALTLWHLLSRTHAEQRAQVLYRFLNLVSLPSPMNREALLSGDPKSMDTAWDALQLGDTTWWRLWKRKW